VAADAGTSAPDVAGRLERDPSDRPPPRRWLGGGGGGVLRFAAVGLAACLLVAWGITAWNAPRHVVVMKEIEYPAHATPRERKYVDENHALLVAMVNAHSTPLPADAEHFAGAGDAAAVREAISRRLGRQVPKPDLSSDGWQLAGAAVVRFEPHDQAPQPAARFEFARGKQRLTLISAPAKAVKDADDDDTYDATVRGQAISGYVAHDGVHCLTGDRDIPIAEMTRLRKRLQQG
jgi:hypothetical protein